MTLRPATLDDADRLLLWRNDPATRAASFSHDTVDRADHLRWLRTVIDSASIHLFVAERASLPIGTARLDCAGPAATISITLAPEARGHGYASELINLAVKAGLDMGIERFTAHVQGFNMRSLRGFLRAGFVPDGTVVMHR